MSRVPKSCTQWAGFLDEDSLSGIVDRSAAPQERVRCRMYSSGDHDHILMGKQVRCFPYTSSSLICSSSHSIEIVLNVGDFGGMSVL